MYHAITNTPSGKSGAEGSGEVSSGVYRSVGPIDPEDGEVPLKGATFADFEDQAETLAHTTRPVVMEERAALEPNAEVRTAGHRPHCGSQAVYLAIEATPQTALRSRHGPVVLHKQHATWAILVAHRPPGGDGAGLANLIRQVLGERLEVLEQHAGSPQPAKPTAGRGQRIERAAKSHSIKTARHA